MCYTDNEIWAKVDNLHSLYGEPCSICIVVHSNEVDNDKDDDDCDGYDCDDGGDGGGDDAMILMAIMATIALNKTNLGFVQCTAPRTFSQVRTDV